MAISKISQIKLKTDANPQIILLIDELLECNTHQKQQKLFEIYKSQFYVSTTPYYANQNSEITSRLANIMQSKSFQTLSAIVQNGNQFHFVAEVGSPTLYQLCTQMSSKMSLRLQLSEVLIIGFHVIKTLEALHKCGIALNNLCLNNLSYSLDKQNLLFCDFRMISSFEPNVKLNQDLKIEDDHSIQDVLDLFYTLSNLLRPDIYAGFLEKVDLSQQDLRFVSGKLVFPKAPVELQEIFEYTLTCKLTKQALSYKCITDYFLILGKKLQLNLYKLPDITQKIFFESTLPQPAFGTDLVLKTCQLEKLLLMVERLMESQLYPQNVLSAVVIGGKSNQLCVVVPHVHIEEFLVLDSKCDFDLPDSLRYLWLVNLEIIDCSKPLGQQFLRRIDSQLMSIIVSENEFIQYLFSAQSPSALTLKLKFTIRQISQTINYASTKTQKVFNLDKLNLSDKVRHKIQGVEENPLKIKSIEFRQEVQPEVKSKLNDALLKIYQKSQLEPLALKVSQNFQFSPSPAKTNNNRFLKKQKDFLIPELEDTSSPTNTERVFEEKVQDDMNFIEVSIQKMQTQLLKIKPFHTKEIGDKFKRKYSI